MKGPDLSKYKRSWGFAIAVVLLMGVFFFGYYFYYIPFNRQALQKDAFLTLSTISHSLRGKVDDRELLYKSYFKPANPSATNPDALQQELQDHDIPGKVISYDSSLSSPSSTTDTSIRLAAIAARQLIFVHPSIPGIAITFPVEEFVSKLFSFQKNEFFETFMLLSPEQGVVYKEEEFGLRSDISIDSLLPHNLTAFFPGARDIIVKDEAYKLFYHPVQLDHTDLVLAGLIRTSTYDNRLRNIPVSFVYPLIICFLLLLIFLPVIKFYVMGLNEQIRFPNLLYFVASIFVGSSLLTITIIQVLLMLGADVRAERDLQHLSGQIRSAFYEEIKLAYNRLIDIDREMTRIPQDSIVSRPESFTPFLQEYMHRHTKEDGYYNFSQVQWIDASGQQRIKGDFRNSQAVFVNVKDRDFYTVYRDRRPIPLPGVRGSGFGMEPLISRTTGEFIVVISKKSAYKDYVTALSARMYSLTNVIVTPGYGFCIIDPEGNVLVHSDSNRNLQENFIHKLASPRGIREVLASRQSRFFPDLFFYGKSQSLNIEPLDKMPFYLVTFYDKGYVFPVNMRILSFSLAGCLMFYVLCMLAWMLLFAKRLYKYHLLYSPMRLFEWAFPQRRLSVFYRHSSVFLVLYIVAMVAMLAISGSLYVQDMGIVILTMISPLNILAALILIHSITNPSDRMMLGHKVLAVKSLRLAFVIMLGLMVLIGLVAAVNEDFPFQAVLFQAALVGGVSLYWRVFRDRPVAVISERYYHQYSILVLMMIMALSIWPAGVFTWYPHNQEILQTVKKQQLYIATQVQERRTKIEQDWKSRAAQVLPSDRYIYNQQFRAGIYSINRDSIFPGPVDRMDRAIEVHDGFYFTIADAIANRYYDPQSYPALSDRSDDSAWSWKADRRRVILRMDMNADTLGKQTNSLTVTSSLPPRYMYVVKSWKGMLLVAFLCAALWALYVVIRTISSKIFLRKFVQVYIAMHPSGSTACKDLIPEDEHWEDVQRDIDSNRLELAEAKLIDLYKRHRHYYSDIWNECNDKEKYLLFDFAHDGLMNYNNTIQIYGLIDRGILVVNANTDEISFCSKGFRAYVLLQKGTIEMSTLQRSFEANSTWQSFRLPFLIVLLAVAGFIFFTQETTFQKIAALLTGISTLTSLLLKFPFSGKSNDSQG